MQIQVIQRESLGLVIDKTISKDEWVGLSEQFKTVPEQLTWAIGDWLRYGTKNFGPSVLRTAADRTGFAIGILRDAADVADAYPTKQRRSELTWAHHKIVASLPIALRNEMLDKCEHEKLTQAELRELIAKPTAATDLEWDGIGTPHAARVSFDRAYRQTIERLPVENWTQPMCRAWLRELEPIAKLCATLSQRVGGTP